jgi:hypothetical protein
MARASSLLLALVGLCALTQAALPPGFFKQMMASKLNVPIRGRMMPDGRVMYIERQSGDIFVGNPNTVPMAINKLFSLPSVLGDGERGGLSFCFDPDFSSNSECTRVCCLPCTNLARCVCLCARASASAATL